MSLKECATKLAIENAFCTNMYKFYLREWRDPIMTASILLDNKKFEIFTLLLVHSSINLHLILSLKNLNILRGQTAQFVRKWC